MTVMVGTSNPTKQPPLKFLKNNAQRLHNKVAALVYALHDRCTPWYDKARTGPVVMYALSPINLIPDFIPVLVYLDDLILIPTGIALDLKMIPVEMMGETRNKTKQAAGVGGSIGKFGSLVTICLWLHVLALIGGLVPRLMKN